MLPATRGAEVLYGSVLRPLARNVKDKAQGSSTSSFQQKATQGFNTANTSGFNTAGTTAPSSFERESSPLGKRRAEN